MHRILTALLLAAPTVAAQSFDGHEPRLPGAGRPIAVEAHAARRAALAERVGRGVVVVPAAGRRDPEADVIQDSDFRQDDDFFYLTGLETPDAWLVLAVRDGVAATTLLLPRVPAHLERWTGVTLAPGPDAGRLTGIADVRALARSALDSVVVRGLGAVGGGVLTTRPDAGPATSWKRQGHAVEDVRPLLHAMRLVKDEVELAALRHAARLTAEGIVAGMRALRPGLYEYQLEAVIEHAFRDRGADRLGFPSIVGSGPNSTVLHYDVNRRRMEAGDLVVVDVGAEYAQHTGDVTRTLPVSGRFTDRQRALYDLVLGAHDAVIAAVRPGVTLGDLDAVARQYLSEHGGTACGGGDCARYFVHGVSHWLGMRVHDVGNGSTPLAPGMVLTVEPGLYLPEEQLGIRIEDDVLVTEQGAEVLSVGAPLTANEIERAMQSDGSGPAGG